MNEMSEKIQQIRREIARRQEFYRGVAWSNIDKVHELAADSRQFLKTIDKMLDGLEEAKVEDPIEGVGPDDGWIRNAPHQAIILNPQTVSVDVEGKWGISWGRYAEQQTNCIDWSAVRRWRVSETKGWRRVAGGKIHATGGEPCDVVSKSGHLSISVPYGAYTPPNEHIHAIRFHK